MTNGNGTMETLASVSNDAAKEIEHEVPYLVDVTIQGSAPILMHRWSCDAVEEKAKARKGSKAKKEDNLESYVYRNEEGEICIPGEYFRMAIVNAAKFKQDPRSPRKSAMDLFKASIVSLTELCSLGKTEWDYLDRRRVMVQRNGITRVRPAMQTGWRTTATFSVIAPEYVDEQLFHDVVTTAGRLVGVGDFRPTYGRFQIIGWDVQRALLAA